MGALMKVLERGARAAAGTVVALSVLITTFAPLPGGEAQAQARFSSVCARNIQKVDNVMTRSGLLQYGASNDLFLAQVNELFEQVYQPCASHDPSAARHAARAREEAMRIRAFCRGPHERYQCTPWGNDERNRTWFNLWEREMRQALSDPNYSADLGEASGPGGATSAQQTSTTPMTPEQDELCRVEMQNLGAQMRTDEARLDANGSVARLELVLWYTRASLDAIARLCPQSPSYAPDRQTYRQTLSDVQSACDAIATRPCTPRRPG